MERRTALIMLVVGGSAATGAAVGIPVAIFALSTDPDHRPQWRDLGPAEDFEVGAMTAARVQRDAEAAKNQVVEAGVYVWRPALDDFVVFSRSCTDLGCPITFDPGSRCFFCPCHGGIFDGQGERMAGPPDRPLFRYTHRLQHGILQVDLLSVPPMV